MRRGAGARRWSRAVIGGLVALVIGCANDDDNGALEGDVPEVESTTTTTRDTSPSSTTTTAACPPVEASGDVDGATKQEADVDGDGQPDVVRSFSDGDHVTLLVELAAGGGAAAEIAASDTTAVALLGAEVLDARFDGRDVIWVRVGSGAATTILGLYHLEGCALEAATFDDGQPVQLPIGGTVATASGARCGSRLDPEADLLVYDASSVNGTEYEITTTEYRWEEGMLVPSPVSAPTVSQSDDPSEIVGFRCGDLSL
jgi:hypothetical protein